MNRIESLPRFLVQPIVEAALREDLRSGDITTSALFAQTPLFAANAHMNFRESGVVCGLEIARLAFELLDSAARFQTHFTDGSGAGAGEGVLDIEARAEAILSAERVALNFVQRLSGIATLTRHFVAAVAGTKARIADTRKTTPGLRLLEKYAVRCGGGTNHRFALDDLILIKDNHIALCGGIERAVERARLSSGHAVKIEVECDTLEHIGIAARTGADILLLDNMTPDQLRQGVQIARDISDKVLCEASGGVTLESAGAIAQSGVDIISVGALTHSVRSLDVGLDIGTAE